MVKRLQPLQFEIPVGISIGRTNSLTLKTQKESIADIVSAFIIFEKSKTHHSFYELNISCPNLYGDITFYPPKNLKELLREIDTLHLRKPVFIKMPIEKTNAEVLQMLKVIAQHCPKGVIFGNLQKDRKDPALLPDEVRKFSVGYFSGKPTFLRSNELIKLTYQHYHNQLIIIGCGGVFSAQEAYKKITLGASLVQLVTGMIFEGPQLASQINFELEDLLVRDGFTHISEAIGVC
jgi:dihydroorotate dehydrogenase